MFNLQGSEIIFILLIALVVLGPEKLPGAIRRITSLYTELRKLSSGFQAEFKSAIDEPMREMKTTADLMKTSADPKRMAEEAEREAELAAAAEKKARQARETTSAMEAAGARHLAAAESGAEEADVDATGTDDQSPLDAFADPVDEPDVAPADTQPSGAPSSDDVTTDRDGAEEPAAAPAPFRQTSSFDFPDKVTGDADDATEEKSA